MTVTSRAGAVIFSVQNYQLAGLVAPFWHPGSPLLHIGGALGGYRSSRKDILGSRVRFSLILCWFRDPILRAFLVLWSNTGDFFHVFYQVFFLWFSGDESGRVELGKQGFGVRGCAKTNLSQISGLCWFQCHFSCFLVALGWIFMTFGALEINSKSGDFSWLSRGGGRLRGPTHWVH